MQTMTAAELKREINNSWFEVPFAHAVGSFVLAPEDIAMDDIENNRPVRSMNLDGLIALHNTALAHRPAGYDVAEMEAYDVRITTEREHVLYTAHESGIWLFYSETKADLEYYIDKYC